jgi:hypothetical protein
VKALLMLTAALEAGTGIALAVAPSSVVPLLLGLPFDAPAGLVLSRVLGAALFALGTACWLSRSNGGSLIAPLLLYNLGAVAVLGHARIGLGMSGIFIVPAVILHTMLAVWCVVCLRGAWRIL